MIRVVDRIVLVGTSHVAKNSISEIEGTIEKFMPEVVGIELDAVRFKALMSENKEDKKKAKGEYAAIRELGAFGYVFTKIAGYVQKKVGMKIGVEPGVDMKGAYMKARDLSIPVALIDMNIKTTMKKLSKLSFFKKVGMFSSMFFKSFKKEYKELLDFDLKSVPDDEIVLKMIDVLRKETPDLYKILIADRNKYMSDRLLKLRENHEGFIVAVVGAGHVEGMIKYLEKRIYTYDKSNISYSYVVDIDDNEF